jgi:hypothetical protein
VTRLVSYHFQSQSGQLLLQSGNSFGSLQRQFLLIQISGAERLASKQEEDRSTFSLKRLEEAFKSPSSSL